MRRPGLLGNIESQSMSASSRVLLACGLLVALTVVIYRPVQEHSFINYDDPDYVTANPHVMAGLTRPGIVWAFTSLHGEKTYWHPLTWLSHMLDCQVFGMDAGAHHIVNVGFHALNAIMLFLVLFRLTGATIRSALVAGLFALHPLQVDTVAWIAERKNLLSTLFFLLSLWAYTNHATRTRDAPPRGAGEPARVNRPIRAFGDYAASLLCFALALTCKPSVVTLPFVMLLLDYWPLHRLRGDTWRRCLIEKVPFLVLAVAASAATVIAHQRLGLIASVEHAPLLTRLANAAMSYGRYLRNVFWPQDLAVFYPRPAAWPLEQVVPVTLLLLAVSAFVLWQRNKQPWLGVGWCWFLGTLVPTIGLVQVGYQSLADRFVYVPLIGLFLALVWACAELSARLPWGRALGTALAVCALAACVTATGRQIPHWRNSETLFTHTVAVTDANFVAHNNLGSELLRRGRLDQAIEQFQAAIQAKPGFAVAYYNLGNALELKGRREEALEHYRIALRLNVREPDVYCNIGDSMVAARHFNEAVEVYQKAVQLAPDRVNARNNLALTLMLLGRHQEALTQIDEALRLAPENHEVHNNLGNIHAEQGNNEQAILCYQKALALAPLNSRSHYNLGNSLLSLGRTNAAMQSFSAAARIDRNYWEPRQRLAQIHAGLGDLVRSVQYYSEVVQLETNQFVAWNDYGAALGRLGRLEEATNCFVRALRLKPDFTNAQSNLSNALARLQGPPDSPAHPAVSARSLYAQARVLYQEGRTREALQQLLQAIRLQPDWAEAQNDAAWLLATANDATVRNGREAVRLAESANELTGRNQPNVLGTLAAAYAEAGRFNEACATAERALALADKAGLQRLAEQTAARLALYRQGQSFRQDAPGESPQGRLPPAGIQRDGETP
jgi:tetratricopeptide (TPR) repeat protein